MFSKISEDHIKQAILAETQEAETKWGEAYNSLHEGYAVLKEEVEEANEELTTVINYLGYSWLKIKNLFLGVDKNFFNREKPKAKIYL